MNELDFGIQLAKKAGKIIKKNFSLGMKKEWKSDNSPVTETDHIINQMVINEIKKEFPKYGILSEEGSNFNKEEYVWVCDPVDGTIPFSHGIPICMFLLALVKNGDPIMGIAYDPFSNRLFSAEKDKGAFLNRKRIRASKRKGFKGSVIDTTFWNQAPFNFARIGEALDKKDAILINFCCIGYPGSLVASGEISGIVFPGGEPYDTAVLKILIEEAGGKVTDIFGKESKYNNKVNGCIASNGLIHDELLEIVKNNIIVKNKSLTNN